MTASGVFVQSLRRKGGPDPCSLNSCPGPEGRNYSERPNNVNINQEKIMRLFGKNRVTTKTPGRKELGYADFITSYVQAVKSKNEPELRRLFAHDVKCDFCGKIVRTANTSLAAKDAGASAGSLVCPNCMKYWVQWGRG